MFGSWTGWGWWIYCLGSPFCLGVTFSYILVIFRWFHFYWGWFYFAFSSVFGGRSLALFAPFFCLMVLFGLHFLYGVLFKSLVVVLFSIWFSSVSVRGVVLFYIFRQLKVNSLLSILGFGWFLLGFLCGEMVLISSLGGCLEGFVSKYFDVFSRFMFSHWFRFCTVGGEFEEYGFYFLYEFWPVLRF